jgi:hypothetical protein
MDQVAQRATDILEIRRPCDSHESGLAGKPFFDDMAAQSQWVMSSGHSLSKRILSVFLTLACRA